MGKRKIIGPGVVAMGIKTQVNETAITASCINMESRE